MSKGSESTKTFITSTSLRVLSRISMAEVFMPICASCTRQPQEDHVERPTQCNSMGDRKVENEWESMATSLCIHFHTPQQTPACLDLPRLAWTHLNHLHTRVGRFNMSMHKWGLSPSANCECGMEEQIPDHILCTFPMYQLLHGLCNLVKLD